MLRDKIYLSKPHLNTLSIQDSLSIDELGSNTSIAKFENQIEEYFQNEIKVACLSSGTAAIHLALILAGVEKGDDVICQSFTFSASANPIVYQGANPIFVDSEKDTWNMCPDYLEKAISDNISKGKKPKAIIVVHLYGMPAKMDKIRAISKKYDIILIEDAAEALGSRYKGQECGSLGDLAVLSFNNNKIITAFGGGALISKTSLEKEKVIFLATQSRDKEVYYKHSEIGYNYKMSDVLACIGSSQMNMLDEFVSLRRSNHQFYEKIFKDVLGVSVFKEPSEKYFSNHWLSCVIIDGEANFTNEELRKQLLIDNIESRPLWKPMHLQPIFKDCNYYGEKVAESLFNKGLCLPSSSNLTDADRERIEVSIRKLL